MQVIKYVFQPHGDERGQLVALEEFKDIPFKIKRVYYMYDTAQGVTRGYHAHKKLIKYFPTVFVRRFILARCGKM